MAEEIEQFEGGFQPHNAEVSCKQGLVNMRSEPTTTSTALRVLQNGTIVVVDSVDMKGWAKVIYDELDGYILNDLLKEVE